MSEFKVIGYKREYPNLNLKLFKDQRNLYEIAKLSISLFEMKEHGFKATRYNKATKKGTLITFKAIKDKKEFEQEMIKISEYISNLEQEKFYVDT
jgi:hypothetical protein